MLTSAAIPLRHAAAPAPSRSVVRGDDDWLPKIAAADVALANALHRHRRPVEAQMAGCAVTIETAARVPPDPDARSFRVTLAGRAAQLCAPARLVDLCTQPVARDGLDRLGAVPAGMLLEFALLRSIKAIEAILRTDIRIEQRLDGVEGEDGRLVPLHLIISGLPEGEAPVVLLLDRQTASAIAQALDELATPNIVTERLPVAMRLCVNSIDLTFAELRTLRAGDIVLPEHVQEQPNTIIGVVGERLRCEVEHAAEGFRLTSGLTNARADAAGEWFMQHPTETSDPARRASIDEALLEQLPVRVVFEVGRLDLPLAEVRRLAPGYVLPLAKPTESAVDVVANGRKIGHGSLMKIGDSIGVRIERLLSDD